MQLKINSRNRNRNKSKMKDSKTNKNKNKEHYEAQQQQGVGDFYQILLGWKTYKYYYETDELPNTRPTRPKKK